VGAPAAAPDPANSDRARALASRIDAFMATGEDDDKSGEKGAENGEAGEPKLLGVDPKGTDPAGGDEPSSKRLVRLKSEPVDLDDDEPDPHEESKPIDVSDDDVQ
jgi:hypothetical protein